MSIEQCQSFCHRCEKATLHTRNTYNVANVCNLVFAGASFSLGPLGAMAIVAVVAFLRSGTNPSDDPEMELRALFVTRIVFAASILMGVFFLCRIRIGNPPYLCSQFGVFVLVAAMGITILCLRH